MDLSNCEVISKFKKYQPHVIAFLRSENEKTRLPGSKDRILSEYEIEYLFTFLSKDFERDNTLPWTCKLNVVVALIPYVIGSSKVAILSTSMEMATHFERIFGMHEDLNTFGSCVWQKKIITDRTHLYNFLEVGKRAVTVDRNIEMYNLIVANVNGNMTVWDVYSGFDTFILWGGFNSSFVYSLIEQGKTVIQFLKKNECCCRYSYTCS